MGVMGVITLDVGTTLTKGGRNGQLLMDTSNPDAPVPLLIPSFYGIDKRTKGSLFKQVRVFVGQEARVKHERTTDDYEITRIMKDAKFTNHIHTTDYLKYLRDTHFGGGKSLGVMHDKLITAVPPGFTQEDINNTKDMLTRVFKGQLTMVSQSFAAAVACDPEMTESPLTMVCDIGGGSSDISIYIQDGLLYSKTSYKAGDSFDQSIVDMVKTKYSVEIDLAKAEGAKIKSGIAIKPEEFKGERPASSKVSGTGQAGTARAVAVVTPEDTFEALDDPLKQIERMIEIGIDQVPKGLRDELVERGCFLTGASSQLRGLDQRFEKRFGIKFTVPEIAPYAVIHGLLEIAKRPDPLLRISQLN